MPNLHEIPEELLEHALLNADVRTIVRCRQVSKQFNDLISNSASIQYKVELALDNQQDGPQEEMVVSERLQALRARRAAWASGQFVHGEACFADRSNWAFAGTHLAWMTDSRQLEVMRIPCTITGVVEEYRSLLVQTISEDIIQALAIDPAQDLLVLMKKRASDWTIEVRSLTTGQGHPDARQDCVTGYMLSVSTSMSLMELPATDLYPRCSSFIIG